MQLSIKSILGSALLAAMPLVFTSCGGTLDDIIGESSNPTPQTPTTSDDTPTITGVRDFKLGTISGTDPFLTVSFAEASVPDGTECNQMTAATGNQSWTGWYYVDGADVTIDGNVSLAGDTYLILCDGAKLTINGYIEGNGKKCYIYGRGEGNGQLVVNNASTLASLTNFNKLQIHGGDIKLTSKMTSAIISTGFELLGGKIIAVKGDDDGDWDAITTDNDIYIYGGLLTATGKGKYKNGIYAKTHIYGGKVIATGGNAMSTNGGGGDGIKNNITITGGTLEAYAGAGNGAGHRGKGINGHVSVNGNGTGVHATKVKAVGDTDGFSTDGYGIFGNLTVEGTANVEVYGGDCIVGDGGNGVYGDATFKGSGTIIITGGNAQNISCKGGYAVWGTVTADGSSGPITIKGGDNPNATGIGGYAIYKYLTTTNSCTSVIRVTGGSGGATNNYAIWGYKTDNTTTCTINYGGGTIVALGGGTGEKAIYDDGKFHNGGSINVSSSTPWYTHNGSSWSAGSPTNLTTTQTDIYYHGVALPTDPTTLP